MTTKRTLGRGLGELLSSIQANPTLSNHLSTTQRFLPIDLLQPSPFQPRRQFEPDALQELADSILSQGILQPILARALSQNRYEIIAGERRWRAAQLAGLHQLPVFIREISDEAAMAMALIENIQREDLNVMEQASALKRLVDEFTMTHETIANAVGKSRASISNLLRLLQLEPEVKNLLETKALEMGHARALLSLKAGQQASLASLVVSRGLSVRETERLVKKETKQAQSPTQLKYADPNLSELQSELSDHLRASVRIQHTPKGNGKILIHYHTLDELEGILTQIKKSKY